MGLTAVKQKYFIVDDDPEIAEFMAMELRANGHSVETCVPASSDDRLGGQAVMEGVGRSAADCVILDIMMPGLDGLDLCRAIKSDPRLSRIKVVIVTAKSYAFDRERARSYRADGYITKPLRSENFAAAIERIVENRFSVTFWGVRGTLPVPGAGSLRYGGNTSCVTMDFPGDRLFIFDAGSGIKPLSDAMLKQGRRRISAKIFISHPHWDHINALPFFVPLYIPGNEFEVIGAKHGATTMADLVSAQMNDIFFPITTTELGAKIIYRDIAEGDHVVERIVVRALTLNHPGQCLGYRVEFEGRSVCYITDNELYLPDSPAFNPHYVHRLTEFVRGADMLITDTTYTDAEYATKTGWGHSCVSQVVMLAHAATVGTLCLFHHDPGQDDVAIDAKLDAANEGLARLGSATACCAPTEGQVFWF